MGRTRINDWDKCPRCGETKIKWGNLKTEKVIWRSNNCPTCGFGWREIYSLDEKNVIPKRNKN